jgi:hypothetical protein
MKRLLWLGVGLAIGALVVRAVSKKAQSYIPRGIAAAARDSGRNLVDSVRDFVDDVREGMHEREQELRTAFTEGLPVDAVLDRELGDELTDDDFDEVFGEPDDSGTDDGKDKGREVTR